MLPVPKRTHSRTANAPSLSLTSTSIVLLILQVWYSGNFILSYSVLLLVRELGNGAEG